MSMSDVSYKSSIYGLINVQNGQVGLDNGKLILRTTDEGLELGRKLLFSKRPLGIGAETEVLGSNAAFVLNENIPASYIHIDAPSNSSNVWLVAVDGDPNNTSDQNDIVTAVHVGMDGTVYSTTEYDMNYNTTFRNPDGTEFSVPDLYDSNIYNFTVVSAHEPNGKQKWHRVIGTSNYIYEEYIYAPSVASDSLGNSYVAGHSGTVTTVLDSNLNTWWSSPYEETFNESGSGGYLVKYDTHGTPQWASYVASTVQVYLHRNVLDKTSNALYVAGSTWVNESGDLLKVFNADGSISSNEIHVAENYENVGLLMKYDLSGNLEWVNLVDGANNDMVTQLAIDSSHNVVFAIKSGYHGSGASNIVMHSQDGNDLLVSSSNGFIIGKYTSDGIPVWGVNLSTSDGLYTPNSAIHGVATGVNNDIFVLCDNLAETLVITNADATSITITSAVNSVMIMKFDSDGIYQWNASILNTAFSFGGITSGFAVDPRDNIYVVAAFNDHDDTTIINADSSSNIVLVDGSHLENALRSHIFQFDGDGHFVRSIAHIEATEGNNGILNMAIDDSRRRAYIGAYGLGDAFYLYNSVEENVYSYSNIDYIAGFLIGLNMENGNVVPTGVNLRLPAQQTESFRKSIFLTTENTTPYTAVLDLENRDGSFRSVPVTLEQSNVTVQKSYRWTSNAWVAESQFEPTASGVNLVSYYYGDQPFVVSGSNYIGSTIAWQNKVIDNKLAFRVTTKCSLASDEEIAYRQFEALVSPVDNLTSNMPYGIVSAEIGDTFGTVFSDLSHTITRNTDHSVDLKVGWNTNSSNYIGNIELHVLASTRLGDITFEPLHG